MSTLSSFEILKLYKTSVLDFLNNLLEFFPDDMDLIFFRQLFDNHINIEESMVFLCRKFFKPRKGTDGEMILVADLIRKHDEKFFLTDGNIFAKFKDDKINHFRNIWQSKRLDKADKLEIWHWIELFLSLAERYVQNEKLDFNS